MPRSRSAYSRRSRMRSRGESGAPLARAGQTSWQRPHLVQEFEGEQVLPAEVGHPLHPDGGEHRRGLRTRRRPVARRHRRRCRLGERLEPAGRERVAEEEVHRVGEDVDRLAVGDVGDEGERQHRVGEPHPGVPVDPHRVRAGDRVPEAGDRRAERRERRGVGAVGGEAEGLEEEAGDADPEEQGDEEHVAPAVRGAVVRPLLAVDAVVTQPPGLDHPAPHHHRPQPEQEAGAQGVEGDLVAEVEATAPEAERGADVAREVVVDGDDDGADEQRDEAPHDPEVGEMGEPVAPPDSGVARHHPAGVAQPPHRVVELHRAVALEELVDAHRAAEQEHRDRHRGHGVEERLHPGGEVLEDLPVGVLHGEHAGSYAFVLAHSVSAGTTSNRSPQMP